MWINKIKNYGMIKKVEKQYFRLVIWIFNPFISWMVLVGPIIIKLILLEDICIYLKFKLNT
jgi:hypothetical protein